MNTFRRETTDNRDGLRWALAAIAVGWFLTLGTRFLVPAILPQIKETFAVGNAGSGVAISAIWMGYAVMQFPAGALADRMDERTLLTASLVLAGLSLGIISVAPVFGAFLVACGLFGLGTGIFGPSRGLALSKLFAPNPGTAFGVTLAAGSVGSAALPFLASLLLVEIGWRAAVGLSLPLFLGTALLTWWAVPATTGDGESESSSTTADLRRTLATAVRDRRVVVGVLGLTIMLFTYQAVTAFLPTYLIQEKGTTQQTAGALFAVLFVAGAGFQLVGGNAADRFGTRPVTVAFTAVGLLTLAVLPLTAGLVPIAVLVVVLSTHQAVQPVMNAYIIGALPNEASGTAWGLLRTAFFLVGSTGSTVVGALSDRGLFDESFYLLAALTVVAVLFFVWLPARSAGE